MKQQVGSPANGQENRELVKAIETAVPDITKKLNRGEIQKLGLAITHQRFYQGPIPKPEDMAAYNQLIPNGAERIMCEAERFSAHRREMEKLAIPRELRQNLLGQLFSYSIATGALAAGSFLAYTGHDAVGGTLITVTIGTLAVAFLKRR